MAFATVADVHQLNTGRATYTASSKPTASQVIDWLEQTGAAIEGILRQRGYSVPVPTTATSALKYLEKCNALGAAALVEQGAQASDRRDQAVALWRECYKALSDGTIDLDAPSDANGGAVEFAAVPSPCFSVGMEF
ncbi:MAG: hypothetical protein ACRD2Z_09745 [Thermoanaerobaculia bacterium]